MASSRPLPHRLRPRRRGAVGALGLAAFLLAALSFKGGGPGKLGRRRYGSDSYYSTADDSPNDDMTVYPAHMRYIPEEAKDGEYKYKFEPPGVLPESREIDDFPDLMQMLPPLVNGSSRIYLCRHGETEHNVKGLINGFHDTWLNVKGSEQAEALGLFLRHAPLDRICSSTAIRAYITADRVACWHPKCRRYFLRDLLEMNYGVLEGMALHNATIRQFYNELKQHWAKGNVKQKVPKGESPCDVEKRATEALLKCGAVPFSHHPAKHIVIVGHGRLNKIIMAGLLREGAIEAMDEFSPQENCCVNVIDVSITGDAKLVSHNLVPHLEVPLPKNTTKHHYHITEDIKEHLAGEAEGGTGGWLNRLERLLLKHRRGEISKDVYEDRKRWMCRLGGQDLGIDPIAELES